MDSTTTPRRRRRTRVLAAACWFAVGATTTIGLQWAWGSWASYLLARSADREEWPRWKLHGFDSRLHEAVYRGDESAVRRLLARNPEPDRRALYTGNWAPEPSYCTPLHVAVERGDAPMVRLLLEAGADATARSYPHGWSALHIAVKWAPPEVVAQLLKHTNANIPDEYGCTPLYYTSGNPQSLQNLALLLSAGADPFANNREGDSALERFVRNDQIAQLKALLADSAVLQKTDLQTLRRLAESCSSERALEYLDGIASSP